MKKIVVLATVALAFSFASCKKDRTCTCRYDKAWASSSENTVTTYDHVSKKAALATCNSGTSYDQSEPSRVEVRTCTLD